MQTIWSAQLCSRMAAQIGRYGNAAGARWFARWAKTAEGMLAATIAVATPSHCAACRRESPGSEAATLQGVKPHLCGACRDTILPAFGENKCLRCAAPLGPFVRAQVTCIHCRNDRFHFQKVIRLGVYGSELGRLCRLAKFSGAEELGAALAELLWEREQTAFAGEAPDLVVPVPHHWTDSLRRSLHLPETVATILARRLRVHLGTHILAKVRRTPKQFGLPPSRRRTNLQGAFRVPRRSVTAVRGRRILLVDDVLTTGTTANRASRVLRDAGAASVVVAVLARGLGTRPEVRPAR